jgi:hypothetical protein
MSNCDRAFQNSFYQEDFVMAYSLYYSVMDFLGRASRLIFGFIVLIIVILLFVGTALDIAYMLNPLLQSSVDKLLDGKRMGGFRLLSKDAVLAREEAIANNKNVLYCYLKKRLFTYIVASVVIYLLLIGPAPLVNYLWKVISPFLKSMGLLK